MGIEESSSNIELDSHPVTQDPSQVLEEKNNENGDIVEQITSVQEADVDANTVLMEEPTENTDINMDTSKPEDTIPKDPMDKDSQPSLTQSTLDNDVLEDLFQEKPMDDNPDDAIKELPL